MSGCSTFSAMHLNTNIDGTFTDSHQNLVWQQERSNVLTTPGEAVKYVENLQLAGQNDWRLPTLAELHNLYFAFDFGKRDKAKTDYNLTGRFWVTDTDGKVIVGAWKDNAGVCCIVREFVPGESGKVKAVRNAVQPR